MAVQRWRKFFIVEKTVDMARKLLKSVIIGPPSSGKGTISSKIVRNFNIKYIPIDELLKTHMKNNTQWGMEAKSFLARGDKIPDSFLVRFVNEEIKNIGTKSWLLEGLPFTTNQARDLWYNQKFHVALRLCIPHEVIIDRLKNQWVHPASGRTYNLKYNPPKVLYKDDVSGEELIQREEDQPDKVKERLEAYEEMAKPMFDFYRDVGILQEFHGTTSKEIWAKIRICLANKIPIVR